MGGPQVLAHAVRRIDLGGKALTNYLIELVSYRYNEVVLPVGQAKTRMQTWSHGYEKLSMICLVMYLAEFL